MPGMKNQRLKYVQFDPNYRFSNFHSLFFLCVEYFCFYSFIVFSQKNKIKKTLILSIKRKIIFSGTEQSKSTIDNRPILRFSNF